MKLNPAEAKVRQRMAPGILSRDGFLGPDQRNIADIVADDMAELEQAGLSCSQVADMIDVFHAAADAGLETEVPVCDGAVTVQLIEVMGRISCPFGCGHKSHKAIMQVRMGEKVLLLTPLHSHLIREHGFFQGRGSFFRLEPAAAIMLYRRCYPASGDVAR